MFRKIFIPICLLICLASTAHAETPDQCATRLAVDISVESFADAIAWYEQVMTECAPYEAALRLEIDEPVRLPNNDCDILYRELEQNDDVRVAVAVYGASAKIQWRGIKDGAWTAMQAGESGEGIAGVKATLFMEPHIVGAGLHQFTFQTRSGTDHFEIFETWESVYVIFIVCEDLYDIELVADA